MDTCPVGVATQNPELRKKFAGDPDHVVNFMTFIAQDVREIMAELGFRTIEEMVGRTDVLEAKQAVDIGKLKVLICPRLLYQPDMPDKVGRFCQEQQDHGLEDSIDMQQLLRFVSQL